MIDHRKIDQFYRLLAGVYGSSKIQSQWPTELDLEASRQMWGQQISKHSPEELKAAIDNAQRQMVNGEDEWQWPNIGLILSGCKRYINASHQAHPALSAPEPTAEEKEKLRADGLEKLRGMLALFGEKPEEPEPA